MSMLSSSDNSLSKEELLLRLEEAEETLRAIRSGEVDALIVSGEQGDQVFTLKDATLPYQLLIEEMNEGALTLSTKGVILYCNPRFAEMLGVPMHTIVGQSFLHYVILNDQVSARRILEQRSEGKSKGELILQSNQAEIPVAISLKEVKLDGELRLGAVVSDLTERKHADAELLRYQKHLEDLVEERTRDLKAGNENLRDSRKAALNLMLDAVAARQQADAANERLQQEITERKRAEEALGAARDELEVRVQERTKELAVANQELLKEIAEREEIERQLRIQTTAMEAAADGIVITDCQGNIQWTNPALAQISGYNRDDLIGHSTKIFNSGQHDPAFYQQMWDTILSGKVWRGETTNRRRDGSLYMEEQTITPVRDNDSEITQFIAIKQDVTARKKAEREIRERDQKEKILTQTIHTMQLDIARDLHDTIGQNISFLRMKLDYLAEKKIRKKTELQLELRSMARAANESYDLMRGTLAVLQSENSTDLFRLFTRYAEQIKERSSFEIDFSSQGEPRFMSAKRMRQLFYIFREILNNIEKHANASQISMAMTWAREALNLVIFDNGIGFDMEKVQYGSHYGLKFMRERAELLNGSMIIRSEVGSGTKIILEVPYE